LRSSVPMPGNPWPHDMLITVDDDPNTLVDLLWIREAWNLHPVGEEVPPLLSDNSVRAHAETGSTVATRAWLEAWPGIWNAGMHHAGLLQHSTVFDRLQHTLDGSPERVALMASMAAPSWSGSFGDDAFTEKHTMWNRAQSRARTQRRPTSFDDDPERLSLRALIPVWQGGLTKIVTIPCQGSYARVIGPHSLLVTDETRNDHQRYSEALGQFR